MKIVKVTTNEPDWRDCLGMVFRVGYLRKSDGLNCVWLVDDSGNYVETVDQ